MLESIARLVRASFAPRSRAHNSTPLAPKSPGAPGDFGSTPFKPAEISEPAAAASRAAGDDLERVAPRTAIAYRAELSSLFQLLGEDGIVLFSQSLQAASRTRHVGRIGEIFSESVLRLKRIEGDGARRVGALHAVAPLYAAHPLLVGKALATRAAHPELETDAFHAWVRHGIEEFGGDAHALESFLALESHRARAALAARLPGLPLAEASGALRHYLRALTGVSFSLEASGGAGFADFTIRDGGEGRLFLPGRVAIFDNRDHNFALYKMLAAQAAGRCLFGSQADVAALVAAYDDIRAFFFGLGEGAGGLSHIDFAAAPNTAQTRTLPQRPARITADHACSLFTDPPIARAIFDQVEAGRTLHCMRRTYRGVARDLDALTAPLLASRKTLDGANLTSAAVELLFRLALVGDVGGGAQTHYAALIASLRDIVSAHIYVENSTPADSLRATLNIYRLLPPPAFACQEDSSIQTTDANPNIRESAPHSVSSAPQTSDAPTPPASETDARGARDHEPERDADAPQRPNDLHDQRLPSERSERRFLHPEWDFRLGDYRMDWCCVAECVAPTEITETAAPEPPRLHALRREFERLRPRDLAWRHPFSDGEELAIDAVVERHVERRRRAAPTERIYAARVRERRSVATLILLDISRSTGEPVAGANDATRVIDCARAGLLAFAAALESIGDRFALCAFNSRGRDRVAFFRLKNFSESMSAETRLRIAALRPAHNTRLGAATRHATAWLKREAARTKVLIVLSDGLPHDGDYGDVQYAVADSARALHEARAADIKTLGVAIDAGQSDVPLADMFGAGRFARIRNVLELPDRLPRLYRRWTR
jgi:Mg-chelatase subunit ChlD